MEATRPKKKSPRKQLRRKSTSAAKLKSVERRDLPPALLAIVDEHKYVSRLLPLLEAEVGGLRQNKEPDYDCLEDIMHYMVYFPDRYHHPKEDLIFERMAEFAPATRKTVARLRKDHEKMTAQSLDLYNRISSLKKSRGKAEALELGEELDLYVKSLRAHMRLEESEVLQPAKNSLQTADWRAIDDAIEPINDPIFGDRISSRYLGLMQRYVDEFVSVSSSGSFPIRLVESTLGRLEKGLYTASVMRRLPGILVQHCSERGKAGARQLRSLAQVRDFGTMRSWRQEAALDRKNAWNRLVDQVGEVLDSAGHPVDVEEMHSGLATITLRTEEEMVSYQQKPYMPPGNIRVSWQAGLMNVLGRMAFKTRLNRLDLDSAKDVKRFKRAAKVVPRGACVDPVDHPEFRATWIVPEERPATRRTILHLPGGGFFAPATDMHRTMLGRLACNTQSRAMLVSYRLLPEYPFPAGLEDALAAYRYLLDEGVRPEEIILSGDSAGGNIALALLLAARDEGLPMPAACALISPCTDLTFSTAAREINRWKDPMLPDISKKDHHIRYADGVALDHPLISPIYGSYANFPPMFAFVSSTETLLDDTLVVARKARAEGVDFEVEIWQGLPHAWPLFGFLPEAGAAVERLSEFVEDQLGRSQV